MKKRVKYQPSVPYYTDEPAVSKTLIADRPLVQNSALGTNRNKFVDKRPARLSGIEGFASKGRPSAKPPKLGLQPLGSKSQVPMQGKLRSSGHPKAHRIGSKI